MAGAAAKHYKMSEIKQKLLRPAQTSVYMVEVLTNPAVNSFVTNRGVSQTRHKEMINLACCEASLPGSSLATHEVNNDYHGSTEKMVYRRIYDDTIDLTFYVDYEYAVIKYFQGWMNYIVGEGNYFSSEQYKNPATFYRMQYPDGPGGYKSDIHLVKFEKDVSKNSPRPTLSYQFIKAFPINIVSTPISYDASDLLKVNVSFSYVRYVMSDTFSPYQDTTANAKPLLNSATSAFGSPAQQAIFNNPQFQAGGVQDLPGLSGAGALAPGAIPEIQTLGQATTASQQAASGINRVGQAGGSVALPGNVG